MKRLKTEKEDRLFIITTYNRPESLLYVIDCLYDHGDILVYNDGSTLEYYGIENYPGLIYMKSNKNQGKQGYYTVINAILNTVKNLKKYKYYIFCPDDFEPVSHNFIEKAIEIWQSIPDKKKICLNLYNDRGRFMKSSWTDFKTIVYDEYLKTQWVDMCFLCEVDFFEAINWHINAPTNRTLSSGVGKYISLTLFVNYSIYQVKYSLFRSLPEGRNSKMFCHERHGWINGEIIQRKKHSTWRTIGIASIPSREKQLKKTVKSLENQYDLLVICLNNYDKIPEFLQNKEDIRPILTDNKYGDAAKFAYAWNDGYYFSCDDDIIYPPDYIEKMAQKIEDYGNNCIITMHGCIMHEKPVKTYYKGYKEKFNLFYDVKNDIRVDVGGTGVMAFDTNHFKVNMNMCIYPNMADIWIAKFAKQQNVPIILVAHKGSDFQYQESGETIYEKHSKNDEIQTQLFNNI